MKTTKKLTLSAIFASMGVVILYAGSLLEVLDISCACLVSFIMFFFVLEAGYVNAVSVYAVISVLSVLLLPNKTPAWLFIFVFGLMPVYTWIYRKTGKILSFVLGLLTFNLTAALMWLAVGAVVIGKLDTPLITVATIIIANVVFILCTVLYRRAALVWLIKLRPKFEKFLK